MNLIFRRRNSSTLNVKCTISALCSFLGKSVSKKLNLVSALSSHHISFSFDGCSGSTLLSPTFLRFSWSYPKWDTFNSKVFYAHVIKTSDSKGDSFGHQGWREYGYHRAKVYAARRKKNSTQLCYCLGLWRIFEIFTTFLWVNLLTYFYPVYCWTKTLLKFVYILR